MSWIRKASLADVVISSISLTYWQEMGLDQKERICDGTQEFWHWSVAHRLRFGQAILVGWDFTHQLTALQAESPSVIPGSRGFGSCLEN